MRGFTHDKSVPFLFSTQQARSQQQTEIHIHLLKKHAPVNDISGVLYLVDLFGYFLHEYGKNFSSRVGAHKPKKYVHLDVVPERRTERCSQRFRPRGAH